jgi:hypothetical protein
MPMSILHAELASAVWPAPKAAPMSARIGAVTIVKAVPTTVPATQDGQVSQPGLPLVKPWPIASGIDQRRAAVASERIQKCRQVCFLLVR